MRSFTAGKNEQDMRLSRFVKRVTRGLPDSLMYKGFRARRIKVNGHRAAPDARLAEGDVVELYLNDEFFPEEGSGWWPAEKGPLPHFGTEYEDDNLAVLYKPAGVLSHRDASAKPTLLDAYTDALVKRNAYNPTSENTFSPALAGRLDRGTEGLVIAAKNAGALRDLNAIVREGLLHKTYRCITCGVPQNGTFHAYLARNHATHMVTISESEAPDAKAISTGVQVMEEKRGFALCQVALLTGRTHQIRAHLAYMGTPLLGDVKYGTGTPEGFVKMESQALCAWQLAFDAQLPTENSLAYLAGRAFQCSRPHLMETWNAIAP